VRWREVAKRIFFARCHGYFAYGERSKEYLMSYGVDEKKIHIRRQAAALPHDYDPNAVLEHYETAEARRPNPPRFLFIGRLSWEKGLFDLLRAFVKVRAQIPDALLDLVGAGKLKNELEREAEVLGIKDCVNFLGSKNLEALVPLFYNSVAMVLPSHSEPWGLVVNESLSYGCPVVVSDLCGCVPELVVDGVTGYRFKSGNVDELAASMVKVTELSKDRHTVSKDCLSVISSFTPERAASQILDGCLTILNDGRTPVAA
jgi:glycosyltransferase involved in cell wall biosynthesis